MNMNGSFEARAESPSTIAPYPYMASELFGSYTGLRIPALTGVVLQVCISV